MIFTSGYASAAGLLLISANFLLRVKIVTSGIHQTEHVVSERKSKLISLEGWEIKDVVVMAIQSVLGLD